MLVYQRVTLKSNRKPQCVKKSHNPQDSWLPGVICLSQPEPVPEPVLRLYDFGRVLAGRQDLFEVPAGEVGHSNAPRLARRQGAGAIRNHINFGHIDVYNL